MDNDKLTEYIERFQPTVYRVAYSYVKNRSDAEDITQEVFLKLYRAEDKFVSDENVKAWLIRVAINMSKNSLSSFWCKHKSDLPESIALKEKTTMPSSKPLTVLIKIIVSQFTFIITRVTRFPRFHQCLKPRKVT